MPKREELWLFFFCEELILFTFDPEYNFYQLEFLHSIYNGTHQVWTNFQLYANYSEVWVFFFVSIWLDYKRKMQFLEFIVSRNQYHKM